MWSWLRNTKLSSALGFMILIGMIWIVGPYVGLPTEKSRFAWIFCVMMVWVGSLMIGRMLADRAGVVLEKFLRRQADDAVMGASPDKRAEVTRLRQRMLAAIDTLKTSHLGKAHGKAALYELPWYMIIGHPAAGKSSAIVHSGLTFPFGDKQGVQGIGGTRDCDWFFSTEGVLLDTAGRYSTQREDRPEWLEFLKLLKKHRSKAPVNGILVAISFPELVQFRSEAFALYARQVRERINEIDDAFGIKVPIYLIFTKIDLLGGFAQFFEDLTEDERQRVWGATLSHDQGPDFDARRVVGQQFDELYRGLCQISAEKLANNRTSIKRPALFAFSIEFNAMREAIGKFVELLFQDDPYHSKPLLRGFYFTSALQEGSPRIAAGNRVASQFDLTKPGFDATQLPTSNGFFLRKLFSEVLFPDQHLVSRQVKPGSSRLRAAGIIAALCGLATVTGGLTWSYVENQKLIASASEELLAARKLSATGELLEQLKALQVLQLRLEQLYQYRKNGYPVRLGMSLYHGGEVERVMRAEYFSGVKSLMLNPVAANLERSLAALQKVSQPVSGATAPASTIAREPIPQHPAPMPPAKPRPRPSNSLPIIPVNLSTQHGPAWPQRPLLQRPLFHASGTPQVALVQWSYEQSGGSPANLREMPQSTQRTASGFATEEMSADSGSVSVAGTSANSMLEDGYNALKTYLMLKQRERMDISHLSDQIPKYWRPWLDANRGKAAPGEMNRLAERVVAFYVSQVGEADLPTIENREELVSNSREVLRLALHKLSAKERVYNELKARANTQFPPMTVGRILNNGDLQIIAGSHAVPGAFTREAWEKYLSNTIAEASRGEVKGDDWVLAATTADNLGKEGDAQRNRAELEALYKADYVREWRRFLQGVAIREFGSLENAAQALGKMSEPQYSAIRLIFARAAYETAWDNPSQISKSIESARNSVIERTEKLILGESAASAAGNTPRLGEVGSKFAVLTTMTTAAEGGRMPLTAYLELLARLKGKLTQIAGNADPNTAALQLMQATLNGSGSELADALALVDGVLLANVSDEAKEIVRPLLVRPLVQAYSTLIPVVEHGINQAWQVEVLGPWRVLANKYPFADSGNEASMADIAKFLKPQEGILPRFVDKNLAGLVTRRGDMLIPRNWANLGVGFSPAFLGSVARLSAAGSAVLHEGEGAKFELQPVPTPGLSEILLEIDGQVLRYRNGPQPWTAFTWPNPPGPAAQGARIQTVSFAGVSNSIANYSGRLGLMRLLAQAKVDNPTAPTVQLEWRFRSVRSGPDRTTGHEQAVTSDPESDVVRFNFRMVSGANPLSLSGLRRLSLPEKITN